MNHLERDPYGMYKSTQDSAGPGPRLMGADTLIGDDVMNRAGEHLGDIKEIMLDMHSGQVAYAVLSYGGMLGLGEKLFAVPWQALRLDTVNKCFTLDVAKERLQNAPGFDKDAWPDMEDVGWQDQLHSFYGTTGATTGSTMGGTMGSDTGTTMGGTMGGTTGGTVGGTVGSTTGSGGAAMQ